MPNDYVEPLYLEIGALVRSAREALGLTQTDVGQKLVPPVTRAAMANMECGNQRIMLHVLVQISVILGVPLTELLPGMPQKRATSYESRRVRSLERQNAALQRTISRARAELEKT